MTSGESRSERDRTVHCTETVRLPDKRPADVGTSASWESVEEWSAFTDALASWGRGTAGKASELTSQDPVDARNIICRRWLRERPSN